MGRGLNVFAAVVCIAGLSAGTAAFAQTAKPGRNLAVARGDVAANDQRIALVIGNAAYKTSPLANPVNDMRAMAAKLRTLGFTVIERENLTIRQIGSTLREFRSRLIPGAVALFFYAGHGVQVKGVNYLPAVDADIFSEEDVSLQSLDVAKILDLLDEAKTRLNLVFLDACRNNPYARSFRSAADGLAKVNAPSGTLISFATRPGSVAADGTGRNGLYTEKLLLAMNETSLPIELTLKRVVTAVKSASKGKQEPWMEGSIEGDFCFGTCGGLSAPTTAAAPAQDAELVFWGSIQSSTNSEDFKAYLEQYPGGRFAGLARNRLKTNTAPPPVQVAVAPPSTVATQPAPLQQGLQNIAAGSVFKDCNDCPEMVAIPAGSYAMGGSRQITISRQFAVGKTEVTFAQWDACVAEGGCTHRPDDRGWGRGSMPVMSVNWDDAKQFVGWLTRKSGKSYRLLTEAEWEYAARAGTTTEYYWGDRDSDICRYASVDKGGNGCGTNQTSLVASKQPNAFGLYDMLGNVWEWVEDCYNDGVSGVPSNGAARTSGDCGLRVLRGGSWGTEPQNARAAYRNWNDTASRYISFNGFRVARTF